MSYSMMANSIDFSSVREHCLQLFKMFVCFELIFFMHVADQLVEEEQSHRLL